MSTSREESSLPDNSTNDAPSQVDYTAYSQSDLISRITQLESLLRNRTTELGNLTSKSNSQAIQSPSTSSTNLSVVGRKAASPLRREKQFNISDYSTRYIALKLAYLGKRYNGYEHANGSVPPKPTIEEVLWKALRKARLISPDLDEGTDQSYDVVWDKEERTRKYVTGSGSGSGNGSDAHNSNDKIRLDLNWEGCQYSKCGRTDKGVSAFGQVIGIRVRSKRPRQKEEQHMDGNISENETMMTTEALAPRVAMAESEMPEIGVEDLETDRFEPGFDSLSDELPYISTLNTILPPDIRILAWCPDPPPDFDARFSCRERRYKYFFTNPAFCPTPGAKGMTFANGKPSNVREGWLDINKMREAAKKLEGLHDFRNLCKIDASKQMASCVRRITFANVQEWAPCCTDLVNELNLNRDGSVTYNSSIDGLPGIGDGLQGPKVYTVAVHGTAFLWHQVRCIVSVLFLVGQGLEEPSIIDNLLDVSKNPGRPMYEMADEIPLVLWDCIFQSEESEVEDSLRWIYAGDAATIPLLGAKNDGKFGFGGIVDDLWTHWRNAKIDETLAGSLLDVAIRQGDGSALRRTELPGLKNASVRGQRVFDGSDAARTVGNYIPVLQKPRMRSLEEQNTHYSNGRFARRQAKKQELDGQP